MIQNLVMIAVYVDGKVQPIIRIYHCSSHVISMACMVYGQIDVGYVNRQHTKTDTHRRYVCENCCEYKFKCIMVVVLVVPSLSVFILKKKEQRKINVKTTIDMQCEHYKNIDACYMHTHAIRDRWFLWKKNKA